MELLKRTLGADDINESSALGSTYRWDSLRHIRVILALEKEFGMQIDSGQLTELISVDTISIFLGQQGIG